MRVKNGKPLYKNVVDDTLEKLSSGALKVGHRFPPEADFATSIGVSRHTLRQAFSQLEQAGIIKRRKRGGTEVIAAKPLPRFKYQPTGFYTVLGVIQETVFDLTDVSIVDQNAHSDLCNYASEASEWVCCTGTRTMRNQTTPFVWSRVFVSGQFSGIDVQAGDSPASIFELIQERYGESMNRMKQRHTAQLCSDEISNTLGIKQGAPVLGHVVELFNDDGVLIELVDSLFDPTRFTLDIDVNVENWL